VTAAAAIDTSHRAVYREVMITRGVRREREGLLLRCPVCGGKRLRLRTEVIACYDARIIEGRVNWQSNRLVTVNPDRVHPKAQIICLDCLATFEDFEVLADGTIILHRGGER